MNTVAFMLLNIASLNATKREKMPSSEWNSRRQRNGHRKTSQPWTQKDWKEEKTKSINFPLDCHSDLIAWRIVLCSSWCLYYSPIEPWIKHVYQTPDSVEYNEEEKTGTRTPFFPIFYSKITGTWHARVEQASKNEIKLGCVSANQSVSQCDKQEKNMTPKYPLYSRNRWIGTKFQSERIFPQIFFRWRKKHTQSLC